MNPAQGASNSHSQGQRPWVVSPKRNQGPTGRPFKLDIPRPCDWRRGPAERSARWAFRNRVGRFPGPMGQAMGTDGPLGRKTDGPLGRNPRADVARPASIGRPVPSSFDPSPVSAKDFIPAPFDCLRRKARDAEERFMTQIEDEIPENERQDSDYDGAWKETLRSI